MGDSEEETEQEIEQKNDVSTVAQSGDVNHSEIDFEIKMWEMIRLFFNNESEECKDGIIEYLGFNKAELMQKQQSMADEKMTTDLTVNTREQSEEMQSQQVQQPPPIHLPHHHEDDEESDDDLGFFDNLGNASPQ